ncbi:UvrD-helicase domain-containing protein [Roseomonas terrae]|uniref:DNA 3'-5' helicase n=1 Tax=Neoroseomonas terrae TaxID=424799 RepID=A0ABS5EKP9_9PROT|nr:UvrD-helicase domain-containing protein [Neoroseomonas terrae]MBR0651604.1 UvrD-helicase domain-containing protein [Neoroseomonas terrae]
MEYLILIGLLWIIGKIVGIKTPRNDPPAKPAIDPAVEAERRANQKRDDDTFQGAFKQWEGHLSALAGSDRWIPKGAAPRFLAKYPAPKHPRKTWRQAVGASSPEESVRIQFDKVNASHLARQKVVRRDFFNTVEKNPLTDEQIHACICMDDSVMVVAAAGSGKTSTMVAKTGYALHEKLAAPEQILLLAFNKATSEELGQRITERLRSVPNVSKVRSNTFHAFGIEVIGKATGKRPALAPWVSPDNPGADIREVSEIIKTLSDQDAAFKRDWDQFRTIYARDVGKWGQDQEPDAYADGRRGFLTAHGEIVKSKEERIIADWLFYNGVAYEYERAYEYDTSDNQYRQYFPDFYYPDANLYHEHFALNGKGEAPKAFKDYLKGVEWKRQLHVDKCTALVETTSHGLLTGRAIADLEQALIARGVKPVFNPTRKVVGLAPVDEQDLARSFRVFQQHVKNNGLTHAQLQAALNEQSTDGYGARLSMYLALYERIEGEWERRLRAGRFIDFEDMLIQAATHVESGAYRSPFILILADEFQDSSSARVRLLKALAGNPGVPTHLCVVGDDWQGINRFAGSDISVMTEFEKTFDYATRLTLNTTFRCPQHLCDVSSQFIQANPAQIKKTVKTTNPLTKTPMLAYGFAQEDAIPGHIEQQLADMHRYAAAGKLKPAKGAQITILLLGRYRRDIPASLARWQQRFGDRLKIDFKTAHGSKGLEAEYVFVLNVLEGTHGFPSQIQDDPALQLAMPAPDPYPFAEERRLFYVAMTRASKQVRFYTLLTQPSQFLVELVKREHLAIEPLDGEGVEPCARPGCGGVMVPRGDGTFLGCSHFPACNRTRKVMNTAPVRRSERITVPVVAGQICPVCEKGVIQEKKGSNGPFYGCSRFRDGCKATANIPLKGDPGSMNSH